MLANIVDSCSLGNKKKVNLKLGLENLDWEWENDTQKGRRMKKWCKIYHDQWVNL